MLCGYSTLARFTVTGPPLTHGTACKLDANGAAQQFYNWTVIKRHVGLPVCLCVCARERNKKTRADQVHDLVTLPLSDAGIPTVLH